MIKPNLFIIGEPKSGTTAVYNYLDQHPEVFMSIPKEPYFFCNDLRKEAEKRGKTYPISSLEEYLNLFMHAYNKKIVGEATPNYLFSRTAADEIYRFNPKSKFIALFREPINFLISSYYHRRKHGKEQADSFQKFIELAEMRIKGIKIPPREKHPSFFDIDKRVSYADHLKRFLYRFSKEQIKIILYEEFKRSNEKIMNIIFDFLNIQTIPIEYKKVNIREEVRFYTLRRILSSPNIKMVGKIFPNCLKSNTRRITNMITLKNPEEKSLDPKFKKQLMKRFKPKVITLNRLLQEYELINKDLIEFWGYDKI